MTVIEAAAVTDLLPHPSNPRVGNVDAIAESLQVNGQYRPIVVQKSTRRVLAGNHTLAAAVMLGWETIDVVMVDVDDAGALRILLADNRTADLGVYDNQLLVELLRELGTLEGTGYAEFDLEALAHLIEPVDLDDLADDIGDPTPGDDLTRVTFHLPADLAKKVRKAIKDTGLDEPDAHADLVRRWTR